MSDSDVLETTPKLKVLTLVADSYRMMFGNLGTMARIFWLPAVVTLVISYRFDAQKDTAELQTQLGSLLEPMYLLYIAVSWVVMAGAYVSLHRFVLRGAKPPQLGFTFEKRELRYLGYSIAILAALMLPLSVLLLIEAALAQMSDIVFSALSVVVLFFTFIGVVRLGLVLPAISLDQAGGLLWRFQSAWMLAKGHTFTMFIAQIVGLLPFVLITWIWPYQIISSATDLITTVILNVLSWLSYAVMISMISIAYRILERGNAEQQAKA